MKNKTYITLNCSFKFHQEIQPINKEVMKEKEELFKKNLEKRVKENLSKNEKRQN
jgi:hypothetical protein